MNLFELLHSYNDEPHISIEEFYKGIIELACNEEYKDNPIVAGLKLILHEINDGFRTKESLDGFVEGVLSILTQCSVYTQSGTLIIEQK